MNTPISSSEAWIVLNAIPHIGPVNTRRLLNAFGDDPLAILSASDKALMGVKGIGEKAALSIRNWRAAFDLDKEMRRLKDAGAEFVDWTSEHYPKRLRTLYDPPVGLYQKGQYRFTESQPVISIVGSRRTTLYGLRIAKQFAQRLATMGFCIVSGLARGVDSAAHEGALEAGGHTVGVLGNGIDIIYPPENLELYRRVVEHGAILSEFCFGRRADRQTFPMRNRIISGLCDGVLVVESDENGGSMITARFAAEQGRQVYAIPGRIDQSTSRGCHRLIKEGAILTTGVEDILEDLRYRMVDVGFSAGPEKEGESSDQKPIAQSLNLDLDADEHRIIKVLETEQELGMDEIVELTALPVSVVGAKLMMLELKKVIRKQLDGTFALN